MISWLQRTLLAVCAISLSGAVAAANVLFRGTLNEPPPCTIDSGNSIDIDFDKVRIQRVDGVNYRKNVPYAIHCAAGTLPWELKLSIKGTATTFEPSALQSSTVDTGIKILQHGLPFQLNTPLGINLSAPPLLEAIPVKRPGASLQPGAFTATATLLAEYQ